MAGLIPESVVERIKAETDIVELVSEYVRLKKTGKNYVGLCPFHQEKTPSFTVVPDKGFYYCFGCGASGSVVNFLMQHEKLAYPEALRLLARRAGITIEETKPAAGESLNAKLYRVVEYAQDYFRSCLPNSAGLRYLKQRGLDDATIAALDLGFAPPGWDGLCQKAIGDSIPVDLLLQAGLVIRKEEGTSSLYDKFRNRVIFPIKSVSGRTLGFGGRSLLAQEEPKYLNSPETPIYHKASVLYGLSCSKDYIRQRGCAVVVEGYFDFASLFAAGVHHVVAVCGTGFSAEQARLLARFCDQVVLLYDADAAGMRASFRAVEVLFNAGLEPRIARLPQGCDPDSFVRQAGREKVEELIASAQEYIVFVKESLPGDFSALPISQQEKVVNSLAETARKIEDSLRRELFVRKAIEVLNLPEAARSRFEKPVVVSTKAPIKEQLGRAKFESSFLAFLLVHPQYIAPSIQTIRPENFVEPGHQKIFALLREANVSDFVLGDFLDRLPDDNLRRQLTEIIITEAAGAPSEVRFAEFLSRFREFQKKDRLAFLRTEIAKAEKEGQKQKMEQLTRTYRDLTKPQEER